MIARTLSGESASTKALMTWQPLGKLGVPTICKAPAKFQRRSLGPGFILRLHLSRNLRMSSLASCGDVRRRYSDRCVLSA